MTNMNAVRHRILVFDSGLGGLSIVIELISASIDADIDYIADTAYFPYGEKSDAALIERVPSLIERAVEATKASLVVIACNTASTLALEQVRRRINIPVIGVVPAIKPAACLTQTGVIGLLATPNTVTRPYTDQLIRDFARDKKVLRHGAIGLAAAAETMLSGGDLDLEVVGNAVNGLFEQDGGADIDVVVLACTHYPHVKAQLAAIAPRKVAWVDSGVAIAQRARVLLTDVGVATPAICTAFTSGGHEAGTLQGLAKWGFGGGGRIGQI
jgi:glutamate racemase